MLYIFHVNSGRMMTFDMSSALDTVRNLKDTIEKSYGIPAINQVLLISGGLILQHTSKVFSYSAGTDTNPIFMFTTVPLDPKNPPHAWPSIEIDNDFVAQVQRCQNLPATYSTVVARSQLSQQMLDNDQEEVKMCEKLVYEQHLQQQAWSAVVASVEDLTEEFRQRFQEFSRFYEEYLLRCPVYLEYLRTFKADILALEKIPIFQNLLLNSHQEDGFNGFVDFFDEKDSFTESSSAITTTTTTSATTATTTGETTITTTTITTTSIEQQKPETITTCTEISSNDLANVDDDISVTEQRLAATATDTTSANNTSNNNSIGSSSTTSQQKYTNFALLNWLTAKEARSSLNEVASNCKKTILQFDEPTLKSLKDLVDHTIAMAEQENIKVIKGLNPRLEGLERLMADAKQVVQEQADLTLAFFHNQTRASNIGDPSILPDLCESHSSQLAVMLYNHSNIQDMHRRVIRSKEELGQNLEQRLAFIVHLENKMSELDTKLLFYNRSLRRLQRHFMVIEQIHEAPEMYVAAVSEVIRRREFSSRFLTWATELATNMYAIHQEELTRRLEFREKFEGHFLNVLFPGLEDLPPPFAVNAPPQFDTSLPNLSMKDLELLSTILPNVTSKLTHSDLSAVINFFCRRQTNENKTIDDEHSLPNQSTLEHESSGGSSSSNVKITSPTSVDKGRRSDSTSSQENDVGGSGGGATVCGSSSLVNNKTLENLKKSTCDSETDTEEFEKLDASRQQTLSATNLKTTTSISTSTKHIETQNSATITEDNLGTTRIEVERLQSALSQMHTLFKQSLSMLRDQLSEIKDDTLIHRETSQDKLVELKNAWEKIQDKTQKQESEIIHRMTIEYELEINDIRNCLTVKDNEISQLNEEKEKLINNMEKLKKQLEEKDENMLKTYENQSKQELTRQLQKQRDDLLREHKTEVESLRSRFKLMSNMDLKMERSPSDTSLEKIERHDYCLDVAPSTLMTTTAATAGITNISSQNISIPSSSSSSSSGKNRNHPINSPSSVMLVGSAIAAKTDYMMRQLLDEKEQELELLRENEEKLRQVNERHVETIEALANSDKTDELRNEIKDLNEKNEHLVALLLNKSERIKSLESEAVPLGQSQPPTNRDLLSSMTSSSTIMTTMITGTSRNRSHCSRRLICVESCTKGDNVLIYWNAAHGQYTIFQESPILYFLHAESHAAFNLEIPSSSSSSAASLLSATTSPSALIPDQPPVQLSVTPPSTPQMIATSTPTPTTQTINQNLSIACIGKVIEKEYCYARKDENRYKVSRGTRFYRVKIRPRSPARCSDPSGKCCSSSRRERIDSGRSSGCSTNTGTATASDISITVANPAIGTVNKLTDSFAQTDLPTDTPSSAKPTGMLSLAPSESVAIIGGITYGDGSGGGGGNVVATSNITNSQDMVDSGVQQSVCGSTYKERNISITEDDEPTSITSERCRYISVCEEDETLDIQTCEAKEEYRLTTDDEHEKYESDEYQSLETNSSNN